MILDKQIKNLIAIEIDKIINDLNSENISDSKIRFYNFIKSQKTNNISELMCLFDSVVKQKKDLWNLEKILDKLFDLNK
jgi:hypothetical protein